VSRLIFLAATFVVVVLSAQGCDDEPRRNEGGALRGEVALDERSVAAIYLNSLDGYEDSGELHGTVVIVREDGTFDTMSTAGISDGSLLYADGAIYGSDHRADFAITPRGTEWRERDDAQLLQESVLSMPGLPTVVFNSGVRRGDYFQDLTGWGPAGALRGEVWGEPGGMVACNGQSVALTSPWRKPGRRADLYRLVETPAGIKTRHVRALRLPSARGILGLHCVGRDVFALEGGFRDQRLGLLRTDRPSTWDLIEGPPIFGVDCGVAGRDIVMIDYEQGGVLMALDAETRRTRELTQLPGDDWLCATDGRRTMVVVDGAGEDPVLQWYDSAGALVDELPVTGLGEYMDVNDESLWGDPVVIDR